MPVLLRLAPPELVVYRPAVFKPLLPQLGVGRSGLFEPLLPMLVLCRLVPLKLLLPELVACWQALLKPLLPQLVVCRPVSLKPLLPKLVVCAHRRVPRRVLADARKPLHVNEHDGHVLPRHHQPVAAHAGSLDYARHHGVGHELREVPHPHRYLREGLLQRRGSEMNGLYTAGVA